MKKSIIVVRAILLLSLLELCLASGCDTLRIGTEKGATNVMLNGKPTEKYVQFRRIRDEDDVEVNARTDDSSLYLSGISLENEPEIGIQVDREALASVSSKASAIGDNKDQFKIDLTYKCTEDLSGVTDVYIKFTLDGEKCTKIGIRKKCGTKYAYAPIEISETSYWGLKNNILTDNGGASNHPENLFDESGDNNVIKKSKGYLNFRVKNTAPTGSGTSIEMDPPIVRVKNEAKNVVYPVLRGAGARYHTLKPGEYTDFKLEFNCISLDTEAETLELQFRPSFHSNYVFKVTKECEGLTTTGLIKKKFQDSFVFDFFFLLFISIIVLLVLTILLRIYRNYQARKGNDSIKNFFKSVSSRVKSGLQNEEDTQLEMDEIEDAHMDTDYEFNPDDVLNTNQNNNDDDFGGEVKVEFGRDQENQHNR
ncbi:unnamed protein product [Moneuplotes crassus]|uniref:Uncharacterized protein n=1 Tax=Euplotes crassus TaxID=5936 RepID=A0AAD1UKI3_EUPCR|nr:unnamed protein product [Moneuplotes crassus]